MTTANTNLDENDRPVWHNEAIAMVRNHVAFAQDGGVDRDSCWDNIVDTLQDEGRLEWFYVVESTFDRVWPSSI